MLDSTKFLIRPARMLLTLLLLPVLAFAQFFWADDGVAIRQGAHFGWNGAAVSAGSDVALFYYDCLRDGTRDVVGNRIGPTGQKRWGAQGRVISDNVSEQRAPVAAAYPDGSVLVVWEDYAAGRFRDLMAQRYAADGTPLWSPPQGIAAVEAYRDQFDAHVAIDQDGYAFIAFTDDRLTTGPETRLNSFVQILAPSGSLVGPAGGFQLIDRVEEYNYPVEVICHGNMAYVLSVVNAPGPELVIQRVAEDGTIGFPGDEASASIADYGRSVMSGIASGLALGWTDRSLDIYGDARVTLLDLNRNPLPGWTADGLPVASGTGVQAVVGLTEAPDGAVMIAVADYEADPEQAELRFFKYARGGALLWGPVSFGGAALRTSPLDWFWDNDDLVVVWSASADFTEYQIHTQRLSPSGAKLWGDAGRTVWSRNGKKLRADVEQPAGAPARLLILSGRAIAQPESLFVGELSATGELIGEAEFISGGWTYDSYDQRAARIQDQTLALVWSDSRSSLNRDVYFQIVDGNGHALLEPQGRRLLSTEMSIYMPPAIAADGAGGAYLAWIGDSSGFHSVLHLHRVNGAGGELWAQPVTLRAPYGFYGETVLVPDGQGGVFAVFTRFNDSFLARIGVAHVGGGGGLSWPEGFIELPGYSGADLILGHAISDGQGGLFVCATTGPWQDTQAALFHLTQDGTPGNGWSEAGLEFGGVNARDRNPRLLSYGDGALLTFEQPRVSLPVYDVKGVVVRADGSRPWGNVPRRLSSEGAAVVRHLTAEDGQGGFLLSWEDFRTTNRSQLFVSRYDPNGLPVWPGAERLICTDDGDQSFMTMTGDGHGGVWVVWEDLRNSDIYSEIDLYGAHLDGNGDHATENGFTWPTEGYPICDVPTYQQEPKLLPWANGSALLVWKDLRSSNPGRCCGAGAVGDIFQNIYAQVLSEVSLNSPDDRSPAPASFALSVYPNPFNPATQVAFDLPAASKLELAVYNLLGQQVEILESGLFQAGRHVATWHAEAFPSGIYFAKLETTDGLSTVRKLTLLK